MFLVVSVLLLALVRPPSSAGSLPVRGMLDPVKALEGKSALVLTGSPHDGQVKLDGEVWTARPLNDDDVYEPGDHVTVMHIDGATAVVWRDVWDTRANNGRNPDGRCGRRTRTPGSAGDLRHHRGGCPWP